MIAPQHFNRLAIARGCGASLSAFDVPFATVARVEDYSVVDDCCEHQETDPWQQPAQEGKGWLGGVHASSVAVQSPTDPVASAGVLFEGRAGRIWYHSDVMAIPNVKRFRPFCPTCNENFTLMAVLPKDADVDSYLTDAVSRHDHKSYLEAKAQQFKVRVGQQKQKKAK